MARIFLQQQVRLDYFNSLKKVSKCSWDNLAKDLKVSSRQLRDWRNGTYSFPSIYAEIIKDRFDIDLPKEIVVKNDFWHITKAAMLGGKKTFTLYGSPGTPEGRRKGGLNSLKTHHAKNTNFKRSKIIAIPNKSIKLAEIIGALLGDGGLSVWQMHISLNLKTDRTYADYLKRLLEELFQINISLYTRTKNSTIEVVANSNKLISFLRTHGLPIGNKIKQGIDIPKWIYEEENWRKACLRGLFDTDGCTFVDSHVYKGKMYKHIGIAFTSYSPKLLQSIAFLLTSLGYSPTISTKWRILLRKERDVILFFQEVKPSNQRHFDVLKKFLEEYRSGYNGIASKAIVAER